MIMKKLPYEAPTLETFNIVPTRIVMNSPGGQVNSTFSAEDAGDENESAFL